MARSYAKVYVNIWSPENDFRELTADEQLVYLMLCSNPKTNAAGLVVRQARKWSNGTADFTTDRVESTVDSLIAKRYLLTDSGTDELWIRSFIRHDRGYRNMFLRKSIETAIAAIESPTIRELAALELAAVQVEDSDEDSSEDSYEDPSDEWSEDTSEDTSEANYRLQTSTTPSTSDFNQQAPNEPATHSSPPPRTPAAAALRMLLDHKVEQKQPTNEIGYRRSLEPQLRTEWRQPLADYLAKRPDATAHELAAHVLGVPGISAQQTQRPPDWYANPLCEQCYGDGLTNDAPEGAPAVYGPCWCRQTNPYPAPLASVHELRPA